MKVCQFPTFLSVRLLMLVLLIVAVAGTASAQRRKKSRTQATATLTYDEAEYQALKWRHVGPFRGGRSATVTGVPGKPKLFYMGATGGGVWRTIDGGQTWENISDGYFGGSIGSVAVSSYDNNVIYVGGGEVTVRGNVSYGYGVYKSEDAGETWTHIGLENSRHIPRIAIHPRNPDLVYAAVMGDLFKPTQERGIYRSKDGGKNWERIHFVNEHAGAVDLCMDPNNPRILYASTWRIRRTPYSLSSGGEGSQLWKSTDGGDTWEELSDNKGMPKGPLGIIGVSVSAVNSKRVYAIVEAAEGGVFRSNDGGETWAKTNTSRALRQRAWYYSRIYADTQDEDRVYVMNVAYHVSTDGGKSFKAARAPHGDHHDLWIAPEDNQRMVIADDGGAQVSYDAGENWTTYHNQPTAQFYRVTTDNHFPYRIYGAQQDNSAIRIAHRTSGWTIGEDDYESTAGGESAHLAPKPDNPEIVFGGSYDGFLSWYNHDNDQQRVINVWPDNPMGHGAEGMKYRFQWNFPIFFSPHNPNKVYTASNHLHVSTDMGQSWEILSPDLTRNDPEKLKSSGGPITQDNTSVEYYCTIFAAAESQHEEGVLWTGSDDGLVHLTRDGGKTWNNVTPGAMPDWGMVNSLEIDPFNAGGAYIAVTRYKMGDYAPYLFHTKDYGQSWDLIVNGIANDHFTRVVRADPMRKGLLYAGTESGMYISFDDGASWKPFQLNLPVVPITDLALKDNNLIAATQGRAFWMIDDLTPLHQLTDEIAAKPFHLFAPKPSYRMDGGYNPKVTTAGVNHPNGVMLHLNFKEVPADSAVSLEILEADGDLITRMVRKPNKENLGESKLPELEEGMNMVLWDMNYPDAEGFDGMVMWWAGLGGPQAVPGMYKARLTVGDATSEVEFEILKDPRIEASVADLQAQFDLLMAGRDKLTETHQAIKEIRQVRGQIKQWTEKLDEVEGAEEILELAKEINKTMGAVEKELYQTKNRSNQDPLNFPVRLNNKLAHLNWQVGSSQFAPTNSSQEYFKEVSGLIDEQLDIWNGLRESQLPKLNEMIKNAAVDPILLKQRAVPANQ